MSGETIEVFEAAMHKIHVHVGWGHASGKVVLSPYDCFRVSELEGVGWF